MFPQDLYTLPNSESLEIAIILESKEIILISDSAILTINSQLQNISNGEGVRCKMGKKSLMRHQEDFRNLQLPKIVIGGGWGARICEMFCHLP